MENQARKAFLPENNSSAEIEIYPNPFSESVNIYYQYREETGFVKLDLQNLSGKLMDVFYAHETDLDQYINITYSNPKLKEGIYFLRIITPKKVSIHKLIYFRK